MTTYAQQTFEASDGVANDGFGGSVAVSRDGSTMVVGAPYVSVQNGAAYIYSGVGLLDETKVQASDPSAGLALFGLAVAVSADGSVVAVARDYDTLYSGDGAVYVYTGPGWATETKLVPTVGGADYTSIASIAISDDGSVIAVGTISVISAVVQPGEVHIFHGVAYGTETTVAASDGAVDDGFGFGYNPGSGVALSADGEILAVGAYAATAGGESYAGKTYVYLGGSWATEIILEADTPVENGGFGASVALSAGGEILVVGSALGTIGGLGSAYVRTGVGYADELVLAASDGTNNNYFGTTVAITGDGNTIVVGSRNAENGGVACGKTYVYTDPGYVTESIIAASPTGADNDGFGGSVWVDGAGVVAVGAGNAEANGRAYLFTPTIVPPPPITTRLYGGRGGPATTSNLYTINTITAAPTVVAPTGYAITGLAFDPTDGANDNLYGATSTNSTEDPRSFIKINRVTGASVLLGPLDDGSNAASDIAFDSDGNLYGIGSNSGFLYTINKVTGEGTSLGDGPGYGSLEWVGDVLYAITQSGGVHTVDPETGAATFLDYLSGDYTGAVQAATYHDPWFLISVRNGDASQLLSVDLDDPLFPATLIGEMFASGAPMDGIAFLDRDIAADFQRIYGVIIDITDDGLEQVSLKVSPVGG